MREFKVAYREFCSIILHILLLLIMAVSYQTTLANADICKSGFSIFAFFSIANLFILLSINYYRGLKIFAPYNLFIIFSFLYNFGQVWLLALGVSLTKNSFTIDRYSDETIIKTLLLFQLFIIFFNLGSIVLKKKEQRVHKKVLSLSSIKCIRSRKSLYLLGVTIFVICAIALLFNDVRQISLSLSLGSGNYALVYKIGRDNIIVYTATYMFPVGVFLSMLCAPSKKQEAFFACYACVRAILMMFIVGSRMSYLPIILCIAVYYLIKKRNVDNKRISIKFLIVTILLLFIYSYVSATRNSNIKFDIENMWTFLINNNPIVATVQELGSTQDDIILLYDNCPNILPYAYGKSFIGAAISFVPFLDNLFSWFQQYTDIGLICNQVFFKGESLGGSYFAEMYYNFGSYCLLVAPLIGRLMRKLDDRVSCIFSSKNYFSSMAALYIFYVSLTYIRTQFIDVVYGFKILLIVYIICILLGHIETERVVQKIG